MQEKQLPSSALGPPQQHLHSHPQTLSGEPNLGELIQSGKGEGETNHYKMDGKNKKIELRLCKLKIQKVASIKIVDTQNKSMENIQHKSGPYV